MPEVSKIDLPKTSTINLVVANLDESNGKLDDWLENLDPALSDLTAQSDQQNSTKKNGQDVAVNKPKTKQHDVRSKSNA